MNKRLCHAEVVLSMLAPQEDPFFFFFSSVMMAVVFFSCSDLAADLLEHCTMGRLPCSESVEMVEPMLSVRIRSTDPDTESCSRRRLR